MAKRLIHIENVNKIYHVPDGKDVHALDNISLDIEENEFVCMVGPSGCGKTTLLNIVAGLEPYNSGTVTLNDQPIIGPGPDRGVIFQQYALFPWMTVRKNIEFGMKFKKVWRDVEVENKSGEKKTVKKLVHMTSEEKRALSDTISKWLIWKDLKIPFRKGFPAV